MVLYVYWRLVHTYGTVAPPAILLYTQPFDGTSSDNYPPKSWKAPFRVVVSLTTTPNRLDKVSETIDSLLKQEYPLDGIYLNVPTGAMKRHPERSYSEVAIPASIVDHPDVTILRTEDYGPATKLIPALLEEKDPETLVITVDDDFVYDPLHMAVLAWEAHHRPNDAIGVCGWGKMPVYASIGYVPVYVPYAFRPYGRYVDILQACCGNAYRRRFFSDINLLANMPKVCVTVDDVWISGLLALHENINRAIISKRFDPNEPSWKQMEMKKGSLKLSSYNDANQIHVKCIRALELQFHSKWDQIVF